MAETSIRIERKQGFTVLPNDLLRDPRLTLKAKGLMAILLGLPDGWEYSISGLSSITGAGKDAIRSALKEMEGAGYLTREQQAHGEGGKFAGSVYTVREVSISPLAGFPTTVNPTTGFPTSDNPTESSKEESKKEDTPPYNPPTGGQPARKRAKKDKTTTEWKPERFELFWKAYPRGENKQGAIRAWDKLRADDDLLRAMAQALKRQMGTEDWQRGIGIPHASTWLNQRRWEDEVKQLPAAVPDTGQDPAPQKWGWD